MTTTDTTPYTVHDVALLAGIGDSAVRRLNARHQMPAGWIVTGGPGGRHLVFDRAAVDAWLPTRPGRGRPRKWKRVPI